MKYHKLILFSLFCSFLCSGFWGGFVDAFSGEEQLVQLGIIQDPSTTTGYVRLQKTYIVTRDPVWVKRPLYDAFVAMHRAAQASGITLRITSGWRGLAEQEDLFAQYGIKRALPPGVSSHHFGYAIDLANSASGGATYQWLRTHAGAFGFCQTYDGHSGGQDAESWHYEYRPEIFRKRLGDNRDTLYLYLEQQKQLQEVDMTKQELFDTYIYPMSYACIDDYPARFDDVITGMRFSRVLDSTKPTHLVYTLSRYKFPAGSGFVAFLPSEIRFVKIQQDGLRLARVQEYPARVQDLFVSYKDRFRSGFERYALLRLTKHLLDASPISEKH